MEVEEEVVCRYFNSFRTCFWKNFPTLKKGTRFQFWGLEYTQQPLGRIIMNSTSFSNQMVSSGKDERERKAHPEAVEAMEAEEDFNRCFNRGSSCLLTLEPQFWYHSSLCWWCHYSHCSRCTKNRSRKRNFFYHSETRKCSMLLHLLR